MEGGRYAHLDLPTRRSIAIGLLDEGCSVGRDPEELLEVFTQPRAIVTGEHAHDPEHRVRRERGGPHPPLNVPVGAPPADQAREDRSQQRLHGWASPRDRVGEGSPRLEGDLRQLDDLRVGLIIVDGLKEAQGQGLTTEIRPRQPRAHRRHELALMLGALEATVGEPKVLRASPKRLPLRIERCGKHLPPIRLFGEEHRPDLSGELDLGVAGARP